MQSLKELETLDPNGNTQPVNLEVPTPHKVAVVLLVQQYLESKKQSAWKLREFAPLHRRNFCMLILKLIKYPDMAYNDFHQLLTSPRFIIDTFHLKIFEATIAKIVEGGIDALFEFAAQHNFNRMLGEEAGIAKCSPVGLYVRRIGVILTRLSFTDMINLHTNICLYYEHGIRALAIAPNRIRAFMFENVITSRKSEEMDVTENAENKKQDFDITTSQADKVPQERPSYSKWSERQAEVFVQQQCQLLETNELAALLPQQLQNKLDQISEDNPLFSHAHFLDYMNKLRLDDYTGAQQAIHRAFDRCPAQLINQQQQSGFQYFSLNLAVLHSHFNHHEEACRALKECVMLAQEDADKLCLDVANSWHTLLHNRPANSVEKQFPNITEASIIESMSLSLQHTVKFAACHGCLPKEMFELLAKSDDINSKHLILPRMLDGLVMRGALWCLYGRYQMSALYSQLALHLNKIVPVGDASNMESLAKALANIAHYLHLQGESQLSQVVLNHARQRFRRFPGSASFTIAHCLYASQQAIYRCSWLEAERYCQLLHSFDRRVALLQYCATQVAQRFYTNASKLLDKLRDESDIELVLYVRVLILRAHCCLRHGGIKLLLRASQLALDAYLEYEHALAEATLAALLLDNGLPCKAYQCIMNCNDCIQINGCVYERAQAQFIFLRCLSATAEDEADKHMRMKRALRTAESVIDDFRRAQAHAKLLDVYNFLAKTYDELKENELRNKYARLFCQLQDEYPFAMNYRNILY